MSRLAWALFAVGLVSPVMADDFNPLGDGSEVNNPDLLGDGAMTCETCAPDPPPYEANEPFFDIDWRVALRGAYVQTSGPTPRTSYEISAVPSVTLRHDTLRGGFSGAADVQLVRSTLEDVRISAAGASFEGSYRLDSVTSVSGTIDLSMTQDSANAPGTSPLIAVTPMVLEGEGGINASRTFGRLVATARAGVGRTVVGPTTLTDRTRLDNSSDSNTRVTGGLRLGFEVTPIATVFVDGSVGYQAYDASSPFYGTRLDASDYQVRTGVSAAWNGVLEAEASIGYGIRSFTDPSLREVGSLLYDASVTFRPDETIEAKAGFATRFGAPGSGGGTARLQKTATAGLAYVVNPWLRLRADTGWSTAWFIDTPDSEITYNTGLGADYVLNEFATLTADYAFTRLKSTTVPPSDQSRVTLGVTISR